MSKLFIAGGSIVLGLLAYRYRGVALSWAIDQYIAQKQEEDRRGRKDRKESFTLLNGGKVARVLIDRNGTESYVYLPYDRRKMARNVGKEVILVKDGERTNITQHAGLPYFVTAQQLGGDYVEIHSDGEIRRLEPNQIITLE